MAQFQQMPVFSRLSVFLARRTLVALRVAALPSGGTMLARLDRETSAFHVETDRGWRRLLHDAATTRDDYLHQLTVTYGFESPFEAACSYTPGVAQVIDLRGRWRSGLLAQDLLALGYSSDDIAKIQCSSVGHFKMRRRRWRGCTSSSAPR